MHGYWPNHCDAEIKQSIIKKGAEREKGGAGGDAVLFPRIAFSGHCISDEKFV